MNIELRGFDQSDYGWHIEVPSNWNGPAYLPPGQSIIYWNSNDWKEFATVAVYKPERYSLDQFANEKLRLVSSGGLRLLVSGQIHVGNIPAYQLGFPGYTTVLVEANGMIYDLGLYGDVASFPTLEKVRDSFRIYNPQTQQYLDTLATLVGIKGMNQAMQTALNAIRCTWPNRCEYRY